MSIALTLNKGAVPVHIWTDDIQSAAIDQLVNVSQLPFIHKHVAAMPDVHAGIGATVGSVIPTHKAIIPAAVGVDIGCGMCAVQLSLHANDLPDSLKSIRAQIERDVPMGFNQHNQDTIRTEGVARLQTGYTTLMSQHPELVKMQHDTSKWAYQLGSGGGGNHFIELCMDERDHVWIMLHSGSRGIGNIIGRYFIEKAKEEMLRHDIHLPDKDLAYFEEGNPNFGAYVEAVSWAQAYAAQNREEMLDLVLSGLRRYLPAFTIINQAINCHHNYVSKELHFGEDVYITRKGAIRARAGELGIIPGSMGTKSYIVRGKGNPDSFCSCSHGAGRRMSRSEAKRRFTTKDLKEQTEGVECRKDEAVIDELPSAYKDIDAVMEHQMDLVETVHTLKQVLCVKG